MVTALAGCASDVVPIDGADTSTSEGESDPDDCMEADETWSTVRTNYPQMTEIWSDGERSIAHGGNTLLTFDGQTSTFHRGVTESIDLREIEATAIDDAWLVAAQTIYHWDGSSAVAVASDRVHPNLEIAADGQVWLLAHEPCDLDQCQPRVSSHQGEGAWNELQVPELPRAHGFWAGPDGELWLGHSGLLSHRTDDGTWEVIDADDVGYEGTQPQFKFVASSIDVDAQGNLWALSEVWGIDLARRSAQGEWTFANIEGLADNFVGHTVFADGEQALIHHSNPTRPLYRWTIGASGVEMVASQTQLDIAEIIDVAGPVDRLHVLSPEPRIQRIDTQAKPVAVEEIDRYPSPAPAPGGAATVDAAFVVEDGVLFRFDGERWRELLQVPNAEGFANIEAVSEDSGWMIASGVLWRWQGDTLTEIGPAAAPSSMITHVWPRSHESAWVFIQHGEQPEAPALEIWRVDGDEQRLEFEWPARALAVAGDEQQVHVVTSDAILLRGDAAGWMAISDADLDLDPAYPFSSSADLAAVGDELLLRFNGVLTDSAFAQLSLRWDGSAWSPANTPLFDQLRSDRHGRAWAIEDETLYRHDGQQPADTGWVAVELEVTDDARIYPAADGVVIHDQSSVSTFRWSCE